MITFKILILVNLILINSVYISFASRNEVHEDYEWSPISAGPLTTWTSPICGSNKFVIQPFFFYNRTHGSFDSNGVYIPLSTDNKKSQFQAQLFMQYGITDELEIDGQIVYQSNYAEQGNIQANSYGLGDSYLFLRYCTFEENYWMPHITGLYQLKLPTGKYQNPDPNKLGTDLMGAASGGGSYDHGFGINLTKNLKPFIVHTDVIYSFPQQVNINNIKVKHGNYLNYDFGIEYFLVENFNLMFEFNGFLQATRKENDLEITGSNIRSLIIAPGIGWSSNYIQTLLVYQKTIAGTNTDANDSLAFTFVYSF